MSVRLGNNIKYFGNKTSAGPIIDRFDSFKITIIGLMRKIPR